MNPQNMGRVLHASQMFGDGDDGLLQLGISQEPGSGDLLLWSTEDKGGERTVILHKRSIDSESVVSDYNAQLKVFRERDYRVGDDQQITTNQLRLPQTEEQSSPEVSKDAENILYG